MTLSFLGWSSAGNLRRRSGRRYAGSVWHWGGGALVAVDTSLDGLLLASKGIVVDADARGRQGCRAGLCTEMQDWLGTALEGDFGLLLRTFDLLLGEGESLVEVLFKFSRKVEDIATVLVEGFGILPDVRDLVFKGIPGLEVGHARRLLATMYALGPLFQGSQRDGLLDDLIVGCQRAGR